MSPDTLITALYVFALAAFLGYLVISRVPPLLHTPLMSATNAISGISLVGSIVTAGADYNTGEHHPRFYCCRVLNDKRSGRIRDHGSHVANVQAKAVAKEGRIRIVSRGLTRITRIRPRNKDLRAKNKDQRTKNQSTFL